MGVGNQTIWKILMSNKKHTRKVTQSKKELSRCKTKKCPKNKSKLLKTKKIYDDEMAKKCNDLKNNDAYYNCSVKVYEKSKYKKEKDADKICGEEKCLKEWEALRDSL